MLFVVFGAALLFGLRLGERSLWSEEVRWAEIPREMLRTGDYLHPTINGRTYYDKPLGSYWLVLAATWLRGCDDVDELAARLPSFASGLLGVVLVMALAWRLYDNRTAIWAGVVLATGFGYVFFARTAASDAESLTGVLTALWIYVRNRERLGAWLVPLWIVMALTSLTKGLLGFALPILVISLDQALDPTLGKITIGRRITLVCRWLFDRWTLIAIPTAAAIYLLPFLFSIRHTGTFDGLQMVFRENIRRFFNPVNHRGPVYLYISVIFAIAAPWSVLLPAALWQHHRNGDTANARSDRFVSIFFWAIFVFFTASASRRSYYLLPILPACAILVARLLTTSAACLLLGTRRFMFGGLAALTVAGVAAGAALWPGAAILPSPLNALPSLPAPLAFACAWFAAIVAVIAGMRRLKKNEIALPMGIFAMVTMAYVYLVAVPAAEEHRSRKPFASEVRERIGDDWSGLALYRNREIVYYLEPPGPLDEYASAEQLREELKRGAVRHVIVRRRDSKELDDETIAECAEITHPWDQVGDKLLLVKVRPR
jgi:4-amino-4-deoxy-L-arabinose transferase-like glycosyltransferase